MTSLFPARLPLLHGPHLTDRLAAWAARRVPHVGERGFGPCWAVGVHRSGALAAVAVFHDFQPEAETLQVSIAAETPRWASREVVAALLAAPFAGKLGGPVFKLWAAIPSDNARAQRFIRGIGFKQEAVLRHHAGRGRHGVIFSMTQPEWRKRQEVVNG